jgi:hypothetical protein
MKYKLTIFLVLFLSTQAIAETYSYKIKNTIIERVFEQTTATPSDPQTWIDFFSNHCGLSFSDVAHMENSSIDCGGKGIDDSEFPSSPGLTRVGGSFFLYNNELTQVDSLSLLTSIEGGAHFHGNSLTNLDGLSSLETVGGYFYLSSNQLTNIDSLSSLRSIGGEFVLRENNLTNVDGLTNLETVGMTAGGALNFEINHSLQNINGLSSLRSVNSNIYIQMNNNLDDISGLNNLTYLGGFVYLANREYTTKLSSTSYLCTNFAAKTIGTEKANACES